MHQQILGLAQGYIRITANVLAEFRGKASFGAQLPSFGLEQKKNLKIEEFCGKASFGAQLPTFGFDWNNLKITNTV